MRLLHTPEHNDMTPCATAWRRSSLGRLGANQLHLCLNFARHEYFAFTTPYLVSAIQPPPTTLSPS